MTPAAPPPIPRRPTMTELHPDVVAYRKIVRRECDEGWRQEPRNEETLTEFARLEQSISARLLAEDEVAVKREDAEDYESRIADELRDMNPYSWEGYVRPLRERHKRICAALAADGTATGAGGEG